MGSSSHQLTTHAPEKIHEEWRKCTEEGSGLIAHAFSDMLFGQDIRPLLFYQSHLPRSWAACLVLGLMRTVEGAVSVESRCGKGSELNTVSPVPAHAP